MAVYDSKGNPLLLLCANCDGYLSTIYKKPGRLYLVCEECKREFELLTQDCEDLTNEVEDLEKKIHVAIDILN